MIPAAFLICALSLPSTHHTRPTITHWVAENSEKERLEDWLKKHNEIDEVFIHPDPQEDKLKEHGWEKVPFTWRGQKIWIKRKPRSDQKMIGASA